MVPKCSKSITIPSVSAVPAPGNWPHPKKPFCTLHTQIFKYLWLSHASLPPVESKCISWPYTGKNDSVVCVLTMPFVAWPFGVCLAKQKSICRFPTLETNPTGVFTASVFVCVKS